MHALRPGRASSRLATPSRHGRRRNLTLRAAAAAPQQPTKDPFADKTVYHDNPIDKFFIKLYSQKMADQLNGVAVPEDASYEDFVSISREIMRGRGSAAQREVVRDVLRSLMPREAPGAFRRLFPPTQWSAEFNALIAASAFFWLVGESEVRDGDVVVGPGGAVRRQRSVVHIKKCRYLEASGCVGMCTNMCKVPTQAYFSEEFGLPLTMQPNFEDLSCEMIFGQAPPPLEKDPVFAQPCFVPQCSLAQRGPAPCPKTDTTREQAAAAGSGA